MPSRDREEKIRFKLERFRELLREYPEGVMNEMILDCIEELEKELRDTISS